jgi:glycosyltransferase involved in cell wall biosynthesis
VGFGNGSGAQGLAGSETRPLRVTVIIPALNEEATIGAVIDEIPRQALVENGYDVCVLVVDGNSSDRTRQIAREKGAEVIVEPRRGKGRAMLTAFRAVDADFVFMLDADYTYPATYIPSMLELLRDGSKVVIGSRLKGKIEKGAMSRLNIVGNRLLTAIARILYGGKTSDLCTGFWGFRGELVKNLRLSADGFDLEADLFIQVCRGRYPVAEVPITYRRRPTKQKLRPFRDGFRIGWKLIKDRFAR